LIASGRVPKTNATVKGVMRRGDRPWADRIHRGRRRG
jgi:hypothetical protein